MSVRITGPVLSALLYEHSCADNDLEGLLLGTVTDITKNTINDSSTSNVESRTLYSIFSCIPCSFGLRWYDNTMKVSGDNLNKLLNEHNKTEIVGWFKLRRNSSLNVSMKERSISKNLLKWLQANGDYKRRDMVFMLCVSQCASNGALFICDHLFMKYDRDSFVTIAETVTNLAETARPSYCPPTGSVTSPDSCYNKVLEKIKPTFFDEKDESAIVGEIRHLNAKLHSKLKSLSRTVEESELSVAQEIAKIVTLRKKITFQQEVIAKAAKFSSSSETEVGSDISTKNASEEPVSDDLIDDMDNETIYSSSDTADLLMDSEGVILPPPSLTPMVVTVPKSSLLDDVQLSESPTDIFIGSEEQPSIDNSATTTSKYFPSTNRVKSEVPEVVAVKTEPVAARNAERAFDFVSDIMLNYTSPTKNAATVADKRSKRSSNL